MKDRPRRERRGREIVLKIGQERFRPPKDITEIVVQFGPYPLREQLIARIRARKLILTGTVVKPETQAGKTVVGFYSPPESGTLAAGSNLARDIRTLLGALPPEGEQVDIGLIFAGKKVRVKLRWSGKGVQSYALMDGIQGEALS